MKYRLQDYPLPSEVQEIESTRDWNFVTANEIRNWNARLYVNFTSKLFAFDKQDCPRMIKPEKVKGVSGTIREILYSRICEKLGILCESAQFITFSQEHIGLVNGESLQAGIFLLRESEYLGANPDENFLVKIGIQNLEHYFYDQITNDLFGQSESGEYEMTPEKFIVRVDIDGTFIDYIVPVENDGGNTILNYSRLAYTCDSCEKKLTDFANSECRKKALMVVCQQVASWTDAEITELSNFPDEFQKTFYSPLVYTLISSISRNVARKISDSNI